MKVATSHYIETIKPKLNELLSMLLSEYEYVSILAEDCTARGYSVSKTGVNVGSIPMFSSRGVVVRVQDERGCGEYAFNQVDDEAIAEAVKVLRESLMPLTQDSAAGSIFPDGVIHGDFHDDPCDFSASTDYEIHPLELGDDEIIRRLTAISEKGLASDERILNCGANFQYQQYSKLFLSRNRNMLQNVMWTNGSINAMAAHGEKVESYFKGFSILGGAELLNQMDAGLDSVISSTLDLLSSEPMVPGEYDCICTPEVTGMIAHEAFGHGVEMDMFVKNRALAKEFIGRRVASDLVVMHDGAAAAFECASYFFDDEGVLAQDTIIIDHGILQKGICDSRAAQSLSVTPTGNGRREAFNHKTYTRMTNTFFEGGSSSYEDMVASISYGFLLENATSGMEDPKNWGIQCMVNMAREIKDGKFTGRVFSPIVLTGYVPDLLKSISMISPNVELGGCGACGKGYKEWVKVSDGGPYIKARIRLG
ncbi:MAG: TldD/PmbA family protein [Clostridiales bacterium]|nr:TldD/PmbA family protein [Clostridiales bacterium]